MQVFCLQQKLKKGRVGVALAEGHKQRAVKIAVIVVIARDRKSENLARARAKLKALTIVSDDEGRK